MNILLETSAPCAATVVLMMRRLNQAAARLVKTHGIIFNAIRDRDAEAAETWMRRHMVDSRRSYELAQLDMEKTVDPLTP
jgi:DNA-binding GntR family transcriptional regulator